MLVALYAALVVWRTFVLFDEERSAEAVAAIHAARITLADVEGTNLPPVPDEAENNATVAGIDKNNNGIRDDVELAIFAKYPDDKKTRAAALQYAMELQMEFTKVFDSATLVAVIQEEGRGYSCVYGQDKVVESLVFNTKARDEYSEDLHRKFLISYALPNTEDCDIVF